MAPVHPQEQQERIEEYRKSTRRFGASIFDPDHPHPHPDSGRGRQIIEESYFVRDARREIEKIEAEIAKKNAPEGALSTVKRP